MVKLEKSELAKTGIQFGSLIRWRNPRMNNYVHRIRKGRCILDLDQIIKGCDEADKYINELISNKQKVLFVATKKQAQEIVKEQAKRCNMPYINKWKGGTLTNFEIIRKKLQELQSLNIFIQKQSFNKLAKKKQNELQKKKNKLQNIYEGITSLWKMPGALFIIGLNKEKTAFKEAKKIGVPVISVCNTNCDPKLVDLIMPGNDEGSKSISFFASLVADIIISQSTNKEKNESDYTTQKQNFEENV